MDDQAVIERLRSDLRDQRDEASAPDWLLGAAHRRWRRRRARRAGAGAVLAAVVLVGAGVVAASRGDDQGSVDAGPAGPGPAETTTTTQPPTPTVMATTQPAADGSPSQSPEDAARDGILPEMAALPIGVRDLVVASIPVPEGEWIIAEPTEELFDLGDPNTCLFGDLSGTPGVDSVCTSEYAEVLLLDPERRIERAYPMTSVNPSWIHVTEDALYGGRIGDGGQPHTTLFRIDRATLELRGLVFPAPDSSPGIPGQDGFLASTAASWQVVTDEADLTGLITYGADAAGTEVTSVIGPVGIDLAGVEALFAGG